ncbi:MAG TPA: hypothetical protein VNJ05_09835 [Sphingomicrobium sp.]|nr:hypothetical protein [Sphingomicrobium sp.]
MRIAIAAITVPLLILSACKVTKDEQNDTITAEYNGDIAENAAEDVGNFAENLSEDIVNDVERTADKVENEVGDGDDGNAAN